MKSYTVIVDNGIASTVFHLLCTVYGKDKNSCVQWYDGYGKDNNKTKIVVKELA